MTAGLYRVGAPAKVNLFLRILRRREDGYHELETAFQAVSLLDDLEVRVSVGDEVSLSVVQPDGTPVDVGPVEDNLVTRAAHLFRKRTGQSAALDVTLVKRIPAGAGLGGGSSDAGAMLRLLNHVHGQPLNSRELVELGGGLGADVAFFAGAAGLAVGTGTGVELAAVDPLPTRTLVIGMPPVHVATGPAYRLLAESRTGAPVPDPVLTGAGWPPGSPDPWGGVASTVMNDFQPVVAARWPEVGAALAALRHPSVAWSLLSGSGGAVFGIVAPGADAQGLVADLRNREPRVSWTVARTLSHLPAPRVEAEGDIP